MRLVLFRSLVHAGSPAAARLARLSSSGFDGVELTLSQLSPKVLDACGQAALRIVCRLSLTADEDEPAARQLDQLSSLLAKHSEAEALLETVILSSDVAGTDAATLLARLYGDTCPRGAQFLEAHPLVGSAHGKRNAHGGPLGNHVLGVCHELRGASALLLAEMVETLPPLRLALRASNLGAVAEASQPERPGSLPAVGVGVADELETLLDVVDHVYATPEDAAPAASVWREIWCQQQADGAREAYMTCEAGGGSGGSGAADIGDIGDGDDGAAELLARRLRGGFDESAEWRAGARARRASELAQTARATLAALPKDVTAAARRFGLSAEQALLGRVVEERWRALAKEVHPDVPGGSDERFLEMKAHYEILADECRRRAPGFVAERLPNARRT